MVRPFGVSLKASGLNPADGSFVTNDQLLLFDNSQALINKAPSFIYYYDTQASIGAGWRLTGDAVTDRGNDVIPPGSAMVVRKASTAGGQTVFWTNSPPVQPFNVVSRKNHGVGVFDINLPIAGNPGIECRAAGPTQVVFTFPAAVTVASASVTTGIGSVSGFTVAGSLVTVNLAGVTNAQRITLSLIGVTDGTSTTGNGSVNSSDISQTKSQSGKPVTASNFRADVTVNGSINSSDISSVKSKSGTSLP